MSTKHKISEETEEIIAGFQHYRCANKPKSNLAGLHGYNCPLWEKNSENRGSFDMAGYVIDNKIKFDASEDDDIDELYALCISCHTVKKLIFMEKSNNKKIQIDNNEDSDDKIYNNYN
jgi:hypothetical protein